jgi:hypothetical protein
MKYATGEEAHLWDRVQAPGGQRGIVVCSMDTDEYSPQHLKDQWAYLGHGIMVDSEDAGLIHYPGTEDEEDLVLVTRGTEPTEAEWNELHPARQ